MLRLESSSAAPRSLPETRVWASRISVPNGVWSEPTLTRSSHQGWSDRCTTLASECGKYTQADPIGFFSWDLNLFRYGRSNPLRFFDPLGLQTEPPPENLVRFPGNPNPYPTRSPFECDDIRRFDPNRVPYSRTLEPRPTTMNPRNIARGGLRAVAVVALAAINIKVWACAIARNYCTAQSTLDYCECMQYADASNNCSALPAGAAFNCPPPPPPPANPPQNRCCPQ